MDGDGVLDLATVNNGSNTAAIWFGAGHGNFGPRTDLAVGTAPVSVALADLNHDGAVDIVVANNGSTSVTIWFQSKTSLRTFTASSSLAVPSAPNAVGAGDLDGDGFTDIVVSGSNGSLFVFFQDPTHPGQFLAPVSVGGGGGNTLRGVAIADVNSDGKNDIVVTNYDNATVSVLLQDPAHPGSFLAPASYSVGVNPVSVRVADLNGDGKLDLVVANSNSNFASVLFQDPANPGKFLAAASLNVGAGQNDVSVRDMDGDGNADIVVATTNDSVALFLQDPLHPGSFNPGAVYSEASGLVAIAAADLDGDGRGDAVIALQGSAMLRVLMGAKTPSGTICEPASYATSRGCVRHVKCVDVNGDGWPDLVVANQNADTVSVLLQDATHPGTFLAATNYSTGNTTNLLDVADLDGDGHPDIAVATNGGIVVFLNDPAHPGQFLPGKTYAAGSSPCQVVIRDFDGDGRPDLAVANSGDNTVSILVQDPANPGTFLAAKTYTAGPSGQQAYFLDAGDVDGDGRPDLVVGFLFTVPNSVTVLVNSHAQPGTFPTFSTLAMGNGCTGVVVRDLDGDGKADIVAVNAYQSAVSVFRGNGDGTFGPRVDYPTGDSPSMVVVADMNGDGKPDLVVVNFGVPLSLQVLVQDPTTPLHFLQGPQFRTDPKPSTCDVCDLNKDGKPDIVSTDFTTGNVTVLLGR